MRKNVIFRNLPFAEQQELVSVMGGAGGVVLSELMPRILFNYLEHARSGTANSYPDGQNPMTFARTSSFFIQWHDPASTHARFPFPDFLGCGYGTSEGLRVEPVQTDPSHPAIGVAVTLSPEVRVIDP